MITEGDQSVSSCAGTISLHLYANLARFAQDKTGPSFVPIEEGETLADIIQRFHIPRSEISILIVNGKRVSDDQTSLKPGDDVRLLGIVGGG